MTPGPRPPLTHRAPPTPEPAWDGGATRDLAERACAACHAPGPPPPRWYARVPPTSWWFAAQRRRAQAAFVLGPMRPGHGGDGLSAATTVTDGSMPPQGYLWLEPHARLDGPARAHLAEGLLRTLGGLTARERSAPPPPATVAPPATLGAVPGGGHPRLRPDTTGTP